MLSEEGDIVVIGAVLEAARESRREAAAVLLLVVHGAAVTKGEEGMKGMSSRKCSLFLSLCILLVG